MQITGTYHRAGAYLEPSAPASQAITLIIGTRTVPTPHKPKHYLLAKGMGTAPARDKWISSLFPVPGCDRIFSFDYAGVRYVLEFEESELIARVRRAPAG